MRKQQWQHSHEPYIKRFTFKDGITTWETCTAVIDGKQCRFNVGPCKDPAVICKTHTKDQEDVLPELDGLFAPGFEDTSEPLSEITVDGWINAGERAWTPEVEKSGEDDLNGKDELEDSDMDEKSDNKTQTAKAEI
jgi:hypothetical protein